MHKAILGKSVAFTAWNCHLLQEDRAAFLKRFFFEPALNIEGIQSGYQGQGVKTILPAEANAKLEVRLVPGLEPHDVLEKIRKQLDKNGFDKVELYYTLGEMSYRSDNERTSHSQCDRVGQEILSAGRIGLADYCGDRTHAYGL